MSLSYIVAVDKNGLMGNENDLPWHLPEDLNYFKKVTLGKPIIMGRRTFESIGRPLPGRENIILTRNSNYKVEGCNVVTTVDEILEKYMETEEEVFIIGGSQLFELFISYVEKIYITEIEYEFAGDTYFPRLNHEEWLQVEKTKGVKNEKNPYDYYFCVYEKDKRK